MRRDSEMMARILARRDAVTGVPRRDEDGDGEAAIMADLGYTGPTTQRNHARRWRALKAYGEAYDRASGQAGTITRQEAQVWGRCATPERRAAWLAQVTISED